MAKLTREQTALINHYGWTVKGVKRLSKSKIKAIYLHNIERDARNNFQELTSPFDIKTPRTNIRDKRIKEVYLKDATPRRYRKAKLDYDANKPEFARGKGNKYGMTYSNKTGEIERGPVGTL